MKVAIGQFTYRKPQGTISIFAITLEQFSQSFLSSNSAEIMLRLDCIENFIMIGLSLQKLSCKWTVGHIDRFLSVLTFWVHEKLDRTQEMSIRNRPEFFISSKITFDSESKTICWGINLSSYIHENQAFQKN